MPKEFLCWEGSCHSTLHWGDRRTPSAGASPLPCCAGCLFLGRRQLWDSQTCQSWFLFQLSLLLISSGMGSKVPLPVSERTGLHSQIIDLNSSSLACCLGLSLLNLVGTSLRRRFYCSCAERYCMTAFNFSLPFQYKLTDLQLSCTDLQWEILAPFSLPSTLALVSLVHVCEAHPAALLPPPPADGNFSSHLLTHRSYHCFDCHNTDRKSLPVLLTYSPDPGVNLEELCSH